jgi:hypothetical protein
MTKPDTMDHTAQVILDMEQQLADAIATLTHDMAYVDDLENEERSEIYAILRAMTDDTQISRGELRRLTDLLEREGQAHA